MSFAIYGLKWETGELQIELMTRCKSNRKNWMGLYLLFRPRLSQVNCRLESTWERIKTWGVAGKYYLSIYLHIICSNFHLFFFVAVFTVFSLVSTIRKKKWKTALWRVMLSKNGSTSNSYHYSSRKFLCYFAQTKFIFTFLSLYYNTKCLLINALSKWNILINK